MYRRTHFLPRTQKRDKKKTQPPESVIPPPEKNASFTYTYILRTGMYSYSSTCCFTPSRKKVGKKMTITAPTTQSRSGLWGRGCVQTAILQGAVRPACGVAIIVSGHTLFSSFSFAHPSYELSSHVSCLDLSLRGLFCPLPTAVYGGRCLLFDCEKIPSYFFPRFYSFTRIDLYCLLHALPVHA